ncbi:MAG: RNB domain-containing ribonuclease [Treponema sp.]|jgi:exoribonuclease-2|nr:RNB domain-containing ribonuclease [Treponema sp.]
MINENALAVYKNKPALVKELTHDKITIAIYDGEKIKVREKDIELIHPGPVKNFNEIKENDNVFANANLHETWELLLADNGAVSLKELAELAFGEYSPASAWAAYSLLLDGLYFIGTIAAIKPRKQSEVEADKKKREEKSAAVNERELFLERMRKRSPQQEDRRFIQDIEAMALGKSSKSRTMKEIGLGETPEEAHALLLECGFWNILNNPHPARFGIVLQPAEHKPEAPLQEDRCDLTRLTAYAIDSPWSNDPDDAVSIELEEGRQTLYVHVADPASSIGMDSPAEKEARDRGATLYIPETSIRMLADEALPLFALGLAETSPALTFRMTLNSTGEIEKTEIFPSTVKVKRLTYKEADEYLNDTHNEAPEANTLRSLNTMAERNVKRRVALGAINIDIPEIHISLNEGQVEIEPIIRYRSADLVRECMLLAGEGAGLWALHRNLPVPYIMQETGDLPDETLEGIAGFYQLRRCMRPRALSTRPGQHSGLGLDTYIQVTSPLRRYTDLLAHLQIRAVLRGEPPLSADEISARMNAGEAAISAVNQAERASRNHWTMAYLAGKKDSVWDAIALEKKGNRWAVIIPSLALETQVPLRKELSPNDPLKLVLKSVNIPWGEAVFAAVE